MGRTDHPGLGVFLLPSADWHESAFLEEPQQLHLHGQRHLADLVEEQGATICCLDQPRLVAVCAGEAAAHMAKKLALEQLGRQRAAMNRHERSVRSAATCMQRAGDEFLASTCGTEHEHADLRRANAPHHRAKAVDNSALTDQS